MFEKKLKVGTIVVYRCLNICRPDGVNEESMPEIRVRFTKTILVYEGPLNNCKIYQFLLLL